MKKLTVTTVIVMMAIFSSCVETESYLIATPETITVSSFNPIEIELKGNVAWKLTYVPEWCDIKVVSGNNPMTLSVCVKWLPAVDEGVIIWTSADGSLTAMVKIDLRPLVASLYGPAFKKPDLKNFNAIGSPDYKSYGTKIKDAVKAQFAAENQKEVGCGVNTIYTAQKFLIEQYTYVVKTLVAHGSIPGFYLEGDVVISDVIGGISINPNNLVPLILDPKTKNFEFLNAILNTVQTVSACIDIVEMFASLQPALYPMAEFFAGYCRPGTKYTSPVMRQYKITSQLEFHAWFLLYILFEGCQINVSDNLLVIGSAKLPADRDKDPITGFYMNVNQMLCKDFLGFFTENYPR